MEGEEGGRVWGNTLRGEEREGVGEDELEIKCKMVLFTKNALCQSWKRIDKENKKRKKKKRERKNEK